MSCSTLTYLFGVIRRHRKAIGSCWRKLNCGQQALLVLVHLRKGEMFAELADGFAVSIATAWRVRDRGRCAACWPRPKTAARAARRSTAADEPFVNVG